MEVHGTLNYKLQKTKQQEHRSSDRISGRKFLRVDRQMLRSDFKKKIEAKLMLFSDGHENTDSIVASQTTGPQ